ncbi:alpha-tocopherol transfer protein-like isoform X2 [Zootermopsis nevadensis]|nr:alpha-tocopherol transfer protein-like isoform X2 [Zootermopsis nevadensis]XP_021922037.1 alpha-tocopherol transfer protein-like isoform X2 [Zootermopsis nevadensis]
MAFEIVLSSTEEIKDTFLSDLEDLPSLKIGDYILQLELNDLSPEVKEIARKELRETPEVSKEAVIALRDLLREEKDLKCPLDSDTWLIRFLRPSKFYPESAFELVKRYYQFKQKHSNVYDLLVPSKNKNIFDHNILTVLPYRDQFGRRILILELGKKWKHNKVSLDEVYRGCVLFLECAMLEPETQVAGAVLIFDMEGLSLQQVWQFTPPFAKRIVDLLQDAIALRIKNIHVVKQPYIFNMVFALFKPFLREKLRSRIIFHGNDLDSLHNYLSPKSLPAQYGGTLEVPLIEGLQWYKILSKCEKEYEAINSYGYKKDVESKK